MTVHRAAFSVLSQLLIGLMLVGIAERGLGAPAAAATPQPPRTQSAVDPFGKDNKSAVATPPGAKPNLPQYDDPNRGDRNPPEPKRVRPDSAQVIRLAEPAKNSPAVGIANVAGPLTDEAICKVLAQRVTIDVEELKLEDIVARLAKVAGANIILDKLALDEADVQPDKLVTIAVKNLTLRSALDLALLKVDPTPTKPLLTWSVEDEVLTITTKEAAEQHLLTKVYAIEDFVGRIEPEREVRDVYSNGEFYGRNRDDLASLIVVIKNLVDPDSWKDNGGPAEAKVAGGSIVVSQIWRNHEDLSALFESLRAIRAAQKKHPGGEPRRLSDAWSAETETNARIRQALARPINLDFKERALDDAIDDLASTTGIPITIDQSALEEADIAANVPVTIAIKNVSLRKGLDLLIQKIDPSPTKPMLTWSIDDEVVTVTTKEAAEQRLALVVYPVLDLIDPAATIGSDIDNADSLINVIKDTIDPDSWKDNGGPAEAHYLRNCGALVVAQIQSNHMAIEKLFGDLRRTRKPPIQHAAQEQPDSICVAVYHLRMAWRQATPAQMKGPEPPAAATPAPSPAPAKPAGAGGAAAAVPGGASSREVLAGLGLTSGEANGKESVDPSELNPRDADELKAAVVEQVGADQWPAGTSIHRVTNTLIVRQKISVQRAIFQFLKALHVLEYQRMGLEGLIGAGAGFISGPTPVVGAAAPSK